jgi:hypothetical protein
MDVEPPILQPLAGDSYLPEALRDIAIKRAVDGQRIAPRQKNPVRVVETPQGA